jgi:hypothetical protein
MFQFAMNNHADRNVLKVDALTVPLTDRANSNYIVIYNINIPMRYLEDEASSIQVLERVKNVLARDLGDYPTTFQITASYELIHQVTRLVRVWTGSFGARNNAPAVLSGFEEFDRNTFVDTALFHIEDIEDRLFQPSDETTKWQLHRIISVIVNAQTKVPNSSFLVQAYPRHGRRAHRTFALP